jgi:hypothetical protein
LAAKDSGESDIAPAAIFTRHAGTADLIHR